MELLGTFCPPTNRVLPASPALVYTRLMASCGSLNDFLSLTDSPWSSSDSAGILHVQVDLKGSVSSMRLRHLLVCQPPVSCAVLPVVMTAQPSPVLPRPRHIAYRLARFHPY